MTQPTGPGALDVQRLAERGQVLAGLVVVGATVVLTARAWARGRPAVGQVSMGPGGWVSVRIPSRGGTASALGRGIRLAPGARRPWWARVLRAEPVAPASSNHLRRRARASRRR
jgi:hypothetical protein